MFKVNLLRGAMAAKGINQKQLAKDIGLSEKALSMKMSGKCDWWLTEVQTICALLSVANPSDIFFSEKNEQEL